MRFLVLGATGMAGHMIATYLLERGYHVDAYSRRPFTLCKNNFIGDATDFRLLDQTIINGNYDIVVNCIGLLNEAAEQNKEKAIELNSLLPHHIASILANCNTRLIHLSTDCVFSGDRGKYVEDSLPDGRQFYDRTKALGEIVDDKNITFRTSIIGPDLERQGIGLLNWFMQQAGTIVGYKNVIWSGITTLTLAKAIEAASKEKLAGLYHLVNEDMISKYDLLVLFNAAFKSSTVSIETDYAKKTNKSLVNTRKDFSYIVPSYSEMVSDMKHWMQTHAALYPHYDTL